MKKTNKGFSLVELIIVIAIMAILAGAIAPALIRYIDKSRKSNDISAAKTVKTAVETAIGNEKIYELITNTTTATIVEVVAGEKVSADAASSGGTTYVKISGCSQVTNSEGTVTSATFEEAAKEIGTNIGETMPKTKYKKEVTIASTSTVLGADTGAKVTPNEFFAVVSAKGTVYVGVGNSKTTPAVTLDKNGAVSKITGFVQLTPETDENYQ
jgi:type IV pilus assembly protein PilA